MLTEPVYNTFLAMNQEIQEYVESTKTTQSAMELERAIEAAMEYIYKVGFDKGVESVEKTV